jgi:hypothetical protein
MAITYLKHEIHGTKIAYMEAEVEADAQNGWIEYNPDTPSKTEEAINTFVAKREHTRKAETKGV